MAVNLEQEITRITTNALALAQYSVTLEKALQKVLDDSEIGIVPKSHLDHIQKLLKTYSA